MAQAPTLEEHQQKPLPEGEEPLYEVIDGQSKEKTPMGALQALIAWHLSFQLGHFVLKHNLGIVVTEMLFLLDAERKLQRRPDIAFVSYPRWPAETVPNTSAWNVVPDLAVEVVSPNNLAEEMEAKLVDYFAAGVKATWVLYPGTGHLYMYESLEKCRVVDRTDEIDGGELLPGFRLGMEKLFEVTRKPQE